MTELCEQVDGWRERGPVRLLCQAVQLARGTYYAWRHRQQEPRYDRLYIVNKKWLFDTFGERGILAVNGK